MSRNETLFKFQSPLSSKIQYTPVEKTFINSLKPFTGDEWDGKLITGYPRGTQAKRNRLKDKIKNDLENMHSPHCIYCGLHKDIVGIFEREHIAPKAFYNDFVFEEENLVLACHYCNGFTKKEGFDTILKYNSNYSKCTFLIVHPYRDDFRKHFEFIYNRKKLVIKAKKYSRKGKTTIKLFGLDEPTQTNLRGASLMHQHLTLTPAQENLLKHITLRDYTI